MGYTTTFFRSALMTLALVGCDDNSPGEEVRSIAFYQDGRATFSVTLPPTDSRQPDASAAIEILNDGTYAVEITGFELEDAEAAMLDFVVGDGTTDTLPIRLEPGATADLVVRYHYVDGTFPISAFVGLEGTYEDGSDIGNGFQVQGSFPSDEP